MFKKLWNWFGPEPVKPDATSSNQSIFELKRMQQQEEAALKLVVNKPVFTPPTRPATPSVARFSTTDEEAARRRKQRQEDEEAQARRRREDDMNTASVIATSVFDTGSSFSFDTTSSDSGSSWSGDGGSSSGGGASDSF